MDAPLLRRGRLPLDPSDSGRLSGSRLTAGPNTSRERSASFADSLVSQNAILPPCKDTPW